MLEVLEVDHVITIDLHSSQIEGFFSPNVPVDNLQAMPVGAMYFSEQDFKEPVIIAPHSRMVQSAQLFRSYMQTQFTDPIRLGLVVKQHILDRSLPGELLGNVKDRDCIIVDKLVDTASTLLDTARFLKQHGARTVSAFAVHGRFSGDAVARIEACVELDRLVVTDTITPPSLVTSATLESSSSASSSSKIESLTLAPMLAEAISRIHQNASVSEACLPKPINASS